MERVRIIDDDVMAVLLIGLALLTLGGFPFVFSFYGSLNGTALVVVGVFAEAGATAVHFRRRDKRKLQHEIMRFLQDRSALPGAEGEYPSVVQSHVGVPTKRFEGYVGDLINKGFLQWTGNRKLVLSAKGIDFLGNPLVAKFFEDKRVEPE